MSLLGFCFDRRVLAVLGLVALATAVLAPGALGAALPLLLLAACPLSMVAMVLMMGRAASSPAGPLEPPGHEARETTERARRDEDADPDDQRPRGHFERSVVNTQEAHEWSDAR
jgi:hypothetical protein